MPDVKTIFDRQARCERVYVIQNQERGSLSITEMIL